MVDTVPQAPSTGPYAAGVILLAGPSGGGKSRLARASGLPVLALDDFYKDGDDPTLPRSRDLGIVDWDHPAAWDSSRAVDALCRLAARGWSELPVDDIARDRATSTRTFSLDGARVFIAEGIFAAEIIGDCRAHGILANAIVVRRSPWKNSVRRLVRDLAEHRKPARILFRRGWEHLRSETAVVRAQISMGAVPCTAAETARRLAHAAAQPSAARRSA